MHSETQLFICYSRRDTAFVDRLYARMKANGVTSWIDRVELKGGDSILAKIGSAISGSQYVLAVLSPSSVNSVWVQKELELATHLEVEPGNLRIIPILRKTCILPRWLEFKLYIDFRSNSKARFEEAIQRLLFSIDADDVFALEGEEQAQKGDAVLFSEILGQSKGFKGSRWLKAFRHLPLLTLFERAVRLRSVSGRARDEILDGLAMVSNVPAIAFNNLLALLGFLRDVEALSPASPNLHSLVTNIVESRSISARFRLFAVRHIPAYFQAAKTRRDKLALLPNIFSARHFDPLSDHLVTQFFTDEHGVEKSPLSQLWSLNAPHYRSEIAAYVVRTSSWRDRNQIRLDDVLTNPDARSLFDRLRPAWNGLLDDPTDPAVLTAREVLFAVQRGTIVEARAIPAAFETLSRAYGSDLETVNHLTDALAPKVLEGLCDALGRGPVFEMLVDVIASPYVDIMTSTIAIFSFLMVFEIEALRHDRAFPSGFMCQKPNPFTPSETASLIECLIDAAEGDPLSGKLLKSLLTLFPEPYVLALASMTCKSMTPATKATRSILAHVRHLANEASGA